METFIAIYDHGVFRPVSPMTLPEYSQVQLQLIEAVNEPPEHEYSFIGIFNSRFSFIGIGHSRQRDLSDRVEDMLDNILYDKSDGWSVA